MLAIITLDGIHLKGGPGLLKNDNIHQSVQQPLTMHYPQCRFLTMQPGFAVAGVSDSRWLPGLLLRGETV
jgi:hypothetical protein